MLKFIIFFSFYLITIFFSHGKRNVTLDRHNNASAKMSTPNLRNLWVLPYISTKDFAAVIELRTIGWKDYFELSELVQCTHKVLKIGRECE